MTRGHAAAVVAFARIWGRWWDINDARHTAARYGAASAPMLDLPPSQEAQEMLADAEAQERKRMSPPHGRREHSGGKRREGGTEHGSDAEKRAE